MHRAMKLMTWGPALAVGLCLASPAAAQTSSEVASEESPQAAPLPPLRFWIDSLSVEGTNRQAIHRIVLGQSRLVAGREYSERDIRDAVQRVKRLPFILDAHPSLRRGRTPGRYELVFGVVEDTKVVFVADLGFSRDIDHEHRFGGSLGLGFDHFLGADSRVIATLGAHDYWNAPMTANRSGAVHLGYQKYDPFGQGSRLTLSAGSQLGGFGFGTLAASALLPVGRNQTLEVTTHLSRATTAFFIGSLDSGIQERRRYIADLQLAWTYETTDDPFSPLKGTRLVADAQYAHSFADNAPPFASILSDLGDTGRVSVRASHVVPLSRRLVFEPAVSGSWQHGGGLGDFGQGSATAALRYVHVGRRNRSRSYVEAGLQAHVVGSGSTFGGRTSLDAFVGVGVRTRATLLRFRFGTTLSESR